MRYIADLCALGDAKGPAGRTEPAAPTSSELAALINDASLWASAAVEPEKATFSAIAATAANRPNELRIEALPNVP